MNMLGIIPARGGSKGIPHKNILEINGKPLICYTIDAGREAKRLGCIEELIVSTDDEEIASISREAGAFVPFLRPKEISGDQSKSVDVMIHAYEYFKKNGKVFDSIILLQPTVPLRNAADIQAAVKIFYDEKAVSLISCYKEEYICDLVSYHKNGNFAIALNDEHNAGIRRQELQDLYIRNGAVYITRVNEMLNTGKVFSNVPAMYVMPRERSVNIDTYEDVEFLKWRISKRVF